MNGASLGFFLRIRDNYSSRFQSLSINTQQEKDGDTEDDTLIHQAFVKYFDERQMPYPEWLGVKEGGNAAAKDPYVYSEYQPVRQTYSLNGQGNFAPRQLWTRDNSNTAAGRNGFQPTGYGHNAAGRAAGGTAGAAAGGATGGAAASPYGEADSTPSPERPGYSRGALRLDNLYNKLRMQLVPGQGYNMGHNLRPTTHSATGLRLRERMLNANRSPRSTS